MSVPPLIDSLYLTYLENFKTHPKVASSYCCLTGNKAGLYIYLSERLSIRYRSEAAREICISLTILVKSIYLIKPER